MDISHLFAITDARAGMLMTLLTILCFVVFVVMAVVGYCSPRSRKFAMVVLALSFLGIVTFSTIDFAQGEEIEDRQKHDGAQKVMASYGIEMEGEKAYDLIADLVGEPTVSEIVVEQDGSIQMYKLDVQGSILNVYEQVGAEYKKLDPAN